MTNTWQYYLLKTISRIICLLPYPWLLAFGRLLGRAYYRVAARQRERAIAQITAGLGLSRPEAERTIRSLFVKLGQTFLEVMYLPALSPAKVGRYITIENRHYLDEALSRGKGVAVLSAHLGNWEWLGAGLSMNGFPVASIVKSQPNDQHNRIINEYRQHAGIEMFTRGTTELVAAAKALKNGRVLGFFSDQDAGKNGVFVEFLGKMASTPVGLAVFARRLAVPVVPAFIVRRPEGGHRIIVSPPLEFTATGDDAADDYTFTVKATRIIEDTIRRYPDEWLWFQKRWNTKWAGEQA
ncbi:lysophospholipid acyltransferase family protein [Anaeroselena agilis]|uniref:Lysophospholipid acyltransferase family protein n=1 Tax=Anaeroselena agilis TaxID=3063788 RepID=A0ABU3P567_9FIRM|nr:lysophospholipid acyltransferase family protein [Selenomonadales bacterium 4137-cl]